MHDYAANDSYELEMKAGQVVLVVTFESPEEQVHTHTHTTHTHMQTVHIHTVHTHTHCTHTHTRLFCILYTHFLHNQPLFYLLTSYLCVCLCMLVCVCVYLPVYVCVCVCRMTAG